MKRIFSGLLFIALFGFILMWFTSYTHYTSIGIDVDTQENTQITHHYYRVRWPGNASIWFGGGISERASDPNNPYEPFDLAATFLSPNPEKPHAHTTLNRLGFWYQSIHKPNRQWWVGIPSFMPLLLIGLMLFSLKKIKRNKTIL